MWKNLEKRKHIIKCILISSCFWGVFSHGMTLFNEYSYHDDATLFLIGSTYSSGRWMLGFLGEWINKLTGSTYYSTPLFKGGLTILFIALACILISDLLDIKNIFLNIVLNGIMISFPTIAGIMGYKFTAPYYLLGSFIGILGVYIVCKYFKWYSYIGGVFLIAASIGTYQANIPICISLLLIYMIKTISQNNYTWKRFLILAIYNVIICVGFMSVYFGINKLMLRVKHIELTSYQGINDFGKTSLEGYLDRCIIAYKEFFNPAGHVSRNMYPFSLGIFYKVLLGIGIFMTIYLIFRRTQKSITYGIQLLLLVLFLPLAVNFIYVMCEQATVHTLMMYGEVFFFVYFIWVLEQLKFPNEKISQVVTKGMAIILLVVTAMYCRFDNICYLKAEILQSQAISYYTTLITRIKSTEGYTDDMPVVYINENKKQI